MEVHVLASWIMMSNRKIRELKYSLNHAKLKLMENIDIDAKLKDINQRWKVNSVINICSDPTNTKILYALVDLLGVDNDSRVVEIDINTGVHTIQPNEYKGRIMAYNKGVFHGHTEYGSCSTCEHVVYTGPTYKILNLPGKVRGRPQLVDNCMVYELNSKDIHKHVVVQLDKFTQDNVKNMVKLPCTIFDLSADKQSKCAFKCKGFIPLLKFGNVVGYIHVISVNKRIVLTNNKGNKYIHSQQRINDWDLHVLTFGKVVLFPVKGKLVKPKTTNNLKVDIYILNDSLEVIKCHTEYSNLKVDDIYKFRIRQHLVLVIQYTKELRFIIYRRKKMINMCSVQTPDDGIFENASVINHAKHNQIVFFDKYNLTSITRLII